MRRFFALIAVALGVSLACGAVTTYDGGYYLFRLLEDQQVFVPNRRTLHGALQLPALLLNLLTRDLGLVQAAFGVMYVGTVLAALGLAWWVVRKTQPGLFLWAVFGICIATLPGQIAFISEGAITMHLAWVLYLALITELRRDHLPVLTLIVVVISFTHPTASVIIGIGAALAFLSAVARPEQRGLRLWMTVALAIIAVGAWSRAMSGLNPYESDQLSLEILVHRFTSAVLGLPLVLLAAAGVAALLILSRRWPAALVQRLPRRVLAWRLSSRAVWLALLMAGAAATLWATFPLMWRDALSYRFFIIPASLPFIAAAWLDSLGRARIASRSTDDEWHARRRWIVAIGGIFALTISIQSIHWALLSGRLREALISSPAPCVSNTSEALNWTLTSPLNHWTITPYGLLVQGNSPRTLPLDQKECDKVYLRTGFPIGYWEWRRWDGGWFDLRVLNRRLNPEEPSQTARRPIVINLSE